MKKIFFFIILLFSGVIFSQKIKIDENLVTPSNIDFKGCVKKITLKTCVLNNNVVKIDTVKTIAEIDFSKLERILKVKKYNNSKNDLESITEYDDLGRVKSMSRKDGDKMFNYVNQYFSTKSAFSDSTIVHSNENYSEKYINHFINDLVIKQDHFVNGDLKDYIVYKYDSQNQVLEEQYFTPKNDSNKTDNQVTFNIERETLYEYKNIKDTLITIQTIPKYHLKKVTKKLKTNKFSLEIKDDYDNDFLKSSKFIYTYKDSTNEFFYYYKNQKEIKDYYKVSTTQNSIVSKIKNEGYANNVERFEIIKIDIIYDKHKNWIRKTYSKENSTTKILEREIDYYCK